MQDYLDELLEELDFMDDDGENDIYIDELAEV